MEQYEARSPLTEKLDTNYRLPRSPLSYSSSNYTSSHVLPPLKFHSGLLKPLSTVTFSVESNEDESDYFNEDDESESVGSAPNEVYGIHTDDDGSDEDIHLNSIKKANDRKYGSTINRGLLKEDLRIEVPGSLRRFTDGELGSMGCGHSSAVSGRSYGLNEKRTPHSAYVSYT